MAFMKGFTLALLWVTFTIPMAVGYIYSAYKKEEEYERTLKSNREW